MQRFWDVLMYTILAAMVVLIVMNASAVSGLLSTGGKLWVQETQVLTGTAYQKAK